MARTMQTARRRQAPAAAAAPAPPPISDSQAYRNKINAIKYSRAMTYNKLWNAERPLINKALKAKGFRSLKFPKGSAAPYYSTKSLVSLLDKAERKTPKKGYALSSRRTLERPYVLPSARKDSGAYFRRPRKPASATHRRIRGDDEVEIMRGFG